jgi:hypothetical protein
MIPVKRLPATLGKGLHVQHLATETAPLGRSIAKEGSVRSGDRCDEEGINWRSGSFGNSERPDQSHFILEDHHGLGDGL